eukprot:TRINITY_DN4980_c0_g1_i3.p1 TRINITY_DN4980_c0_g1~~TRINITY_DN4980_c0_g1_i3.p1  ORF type:complete len:341 (+),score=69.65 TRINITY_DN4980_c0_g1_i3:29-1051(+)
MTDETEFECPVCMEGFSESKCVPRVLPCLHDVCGECVSRLPKNECPVCRAKFTRDLGVNRTLLKALDMVSQFTREMTHLAEAYPFILDALEELRSSGIVANNDNKNNKKNSVTEDTSSMKRRSSSPQAAPPTTEAKPRFSPPPCEPFSWKVGDMVDVMDKNNKWYQCQVTATQGHQVRIHYIGWNEKWDEWIPRDSPRIAKLESHTGVKRLERIKVGDLIDAQDRQGKWYESVVQAIKDGQFLVHYNGWSSKWDEWISIESDRLAELHTHSAKQISPAGNVRRLSVGDAIDAKDPWNKWCKATVLKAQRDVVLIHYDGFSSKYDEWIAIESARLAPRNSH